MTGWPCGGPAYLEMLAVVIQCVQLVSREMQAAFLVVEEGVVFPGVPKPCHHIHEFLGARVAVGVLGVLVQVEVARLGVGPRRHHIPAGAAAAEVIERGELACDVEGLVVGGGDGGHQADALGHRGQCREQRQRLEAGCARGAGQGGVVKRADCDAIGEKDRIELRGLGALRQPHVVRKILPGVGLCAGVAPAGHMVAGGLQEGAELELALMRGLAHLWLPYAAARAGAAWLAGSACLGAADFTDTLRRPSTLTGTSPAMVTRRTTRFASP